MTMDSAQIINELHRFLARLTRRDDFSETDDLLAAGIVDSLNFVELIIFIERTFSVRFNAGTFNFPSYATVARLAEYILTRQRNAGDRKGRKK